MKKHPNYGHIIKTRISSAIYQAMNRRCNQTGETLDHIIQTALATELNINHHTLFQVSTSTALVQGIYNGCMSIAEIKKHGNFGLGTFDELDGEGILLDGVAWQARGDGSVVIAPDTALAPFWVVTKFTPQITTKINCIKSFADLCKQIDTLRTSQNIFSSICIKGIFKNIKYRVACRTRQGIDLVTATNNQAIFKVEECSGTLIGFWSPQYAKTLNVPGYHLHLLSDDHKHGGHVLEVSGSDLKLQLAAESEFKVALPESAEFLQADLNIDPSASLAKAEGIKDT
ncbi:MAG: budA [Burkholderiales bacterium]|jgi:acetolactate decarboxylase|nr:budA [Burkholderiales bacterium]